MICVTFLVVKNNYIADDYANEYFTEEEYFFEIAEAVFVGWFTFEYVIRFLAAPEKLR